VKRSRGRGRRPQHSNHGGGGGGGGNNGGGGFNPNRVFDSNGPEVKIRGSATTVYEKYLQLARDANSSGDRVMAENYLQHAEHYYRIVAAQQAQMQQMQQQQQAQQQQNGGGQQPNGNGNGQNRGPNGSGDQPYKQGAAPASGATFTLTEGEEQEEAAE